MLSLTSKIREVLNSYQEDPYDINDGLCEEFMKDVTKSVKNAEECSTGLVFDNPYMKYPIHVWIFYNGKHYDAECPEGVTNFMDLPFFKRESISETFDKEDLRDNRYTEGV